MANLDHTLRETEKSTQDSNMADSALSTLRQQAGVVYDVLACTLIVAVGG